MDAAGVAITPVGQNVLTAPLQSSLTDLTAYRGLAFELAGAGSRSYNFQGYQDVDNGPDPASGRGATLPAAVGADSAGAWQSHIRDWGTITRASENP